MGSKAKITKYIVPIIQQKIDESGARYYVEPFAGGCNVIDKIKNLTGSSANWRAIYNQNKGVIGGNPNLIYPGQNLVINV